MFKCYHLWSHYITITISAKLHSEVDTLDLRLYFIYSLRVCDNQGFCPPTKQITVWSSPPYGLTNLLWWHHTKSSYTKKCSVLGLETLDSRRETIALHFARSTARKSRHMDMFTPTPILVNTTQVLNLCAEHINITHKDWPTYWTTSYEQCEKLGQHCEQVDEWCASWCGPWSCDTSGVIEFHYTWCYPCFK